MLAVLTVVFLTIGLVGCLRARGWAEHRISKSWFAIALRLSPYIVLLAVLTALPRLLSVINRGQPVELRVIFSYWPPLGVLFITALAAALSVKALRIARLAAARNARKSGNSP